MDFKFEETDGGLGPKKGPVPPGLRSPGPSWPKFYPSGNVSMPRDDPAARGVKASGPPEGGVAVLHGENGAE